MHDRLVVQAELLRFNRLAQVLFQLQPASRVLVLIQDGAGWREKVFTTLYANPETGFRMPPLTPKHFSFNVDGGRLM